MKTKLQILVTVLSIGYSMVTASAQQTTGGGGGTSTTTSTSRTFINPQTHEMINPETGLPETVVQIDPTTGLPADGSPPFKDTNGVATWIDPKWKDPDVVLQRIDFQAYPLTEVAHRLQERFIQALKVDYFDIIFPTASSGFDPTQITVNLELENVKASEIFSAMNLQFELDKSPLRWELTVNGSRPTAILRNLAQLGAPSQIRKVFYAGDILEAFAGTNDIQKLRSISDTIRDAWNDTGVQAGIVNIYPSGQLLIVSGTPDQVDVAEQTLRALKEKADYDDSHPPQKPVNQK